MQIRTSRHVDAGEQDKDGVYEYYYEYDLIVFLADSQTLVARSYVDESHEAHLLRIESRTDRRGLTSEDVSTTLAVAAAAYLRAHGKTMINWLNVEGGGYEPQDEATPGSGS